MLRQMSGANFLISVRQLVDSERKLRVLNRLSDVKAIFASDSEPFCDKLLPSAETFDDEIDVTYMTEELSLFSWSLHCEYMHDTGVLYYVAGYIGRSICRQRKCSACKNLLLEGDDPVELEMEIHFDHAM